jgi:plasmid replication protein
MKKRKKLTESGNSVSKAVELNNVDASTYINSTTETKEKQGNTTKQDDLKGRHFAYVVYPESAPTDWIEQMQNTGLAFVISPLHDKDTNPDNTPKKPHYHMIVSWGNTTTYKSAKGLCDMLNCPIPQMLRNCTGMYRYLTHKDNPEKYQYTEIPKTYNG